MAAIVRPLTPEAAELDAAFDRLTQPSTRWWTLFRSSVDAGQPDPTATIPESIIRTVHSSPDDEYFSSLETIGIGCVQRTETAKALHPTIGTVEEVVSVIADLERYLPVTTLPALSKTSTTEVEALVEEAIEKFGTEIWRAKKRCKDVYAASVAERRRSQHTGDDKLPKVEEPYEDE